MTEVKACVTLVCASTNDGRPLTGDTHLIWTVVRVSYRGGGGGGGAWNSPPPQKS